MYKKRLKFVIGLVAAGSLALAGCSQATQAQGSVTLIVHDSFTVENFEDIVKEATGLDVTVITSGSGQELSTTLALTAAEPLADAFYGIDNFFASRLVDNGVTEPYLAEGMSARTKEHLYDESGSMTPITIGATCMNVDLDWFADSDLPAPKTYEDLLKSEYAGLTALIDPISSTTGASFFVGTVAEFGFDGAGEYWKDLVANGAVIADGWSAAYYGEFTGGSEDGTKPIVVSYSSSPAYTTNEDETLSHTAALLDTCSSTVEYAGVLQNAANPAGAKKLIDFLLSASFQDLVAESMYVYPIDESAYVPESWQKFAPLPTSPNDLSAAEIGENREAWLRELADKLGL